MSLATWCWAKSSPSSPDVYKALPNGQFRPYSAQSPIDGKRKRYESVEDVLNEVDLLEEQNKKYPTGQYLYLLVPLFADVNHLIDDWMWEMIQEYNYVNRFNVSLGNLDDVSAHRLDCFTIIENELNNIAKYERENGN